MDEGVKRRGGHRNIPQDTRRGGSLPALIFGMLGGEIPDFRGARTMAAQPAGSYARIYQAVRRIPRGRVASYGQVARVAGLPGRARQVGYAMFALPKGSRVPWHRVINAEGKVSRRRVPGAELTQRMLLEEEGVRFGAGGRISLPRYGWKFRSAG